MQQYTRLLSDREVLDILTLSGSATAIYTSEDIVIEMANDAMLAFWGKGREIIGLPLYDGVPELKGQPFKHMLQEVLRTGVTDSGIITATTRIGGKLQENYFEYEYRAIKDESGNPYAILHRAENVTEREFRKRDLRFREEQVSELNEELAVNNEMLRSTNEELTAANEELRTTNDYISQLNEELRKYVAEQIRDEQRKNEFISMVSHELKTPLTSLNSFIQVLQRKTLKVGDESTSGMLDMAHNQIRKMTSLITGFLNVARLDSSQLQIDRKCLDLKSLIMSTEEETRVQVSTHRMIFDPVKSMMVYADYDKIGQVLSNLISNAVKYSPPGSTIKISCTVLDDQAVVRVKDEGIGVSEEDLPKLFERYFRAANVGSLQISGFGIGLYLCRKIIERHHGSIWAESQSGQGSAFYFTLPLDESCIKEKK